MSDEPDIIKQLREADRFGSLRSSMQQSLEESEKIDSMEDADKVTIFETKGLFEKVNDELDFGTYDQKKLYQSVVGLSPDGVFVLDLKGIVLSCNDSAVTILGYSRDELVGRKFSDIGHYSKRDIAKFLKLFVSIIKGKVVEPFELEITRKNGTFFTAEIRVSLLDENGKKKGIQAVVRDVTDQKNSFKRIKESEEKYRYLFEKMPNAFAYHQIVTDTAGKPVDYVFLEVNDSFEKQTGLKKDRLIGKKVTEAIPGIEKDPADWITKYGDIALNGGELRFEQFAEGLNAWYQVYAYSPKKGFFVTIFEDISDRKEKEKEIHLKNHGMNSALSPIAISDLEGTITYVNESFMKLWGYRIAGDVIGKKVTTFWSNPDDALHVVDELKKKGSWSGELSAKTRDGEIFPVKVFSNIIHDDAGGPIAMMSSFQDMTDQKKYQLYLVEKNNFENIRAKIWEIAATHQNEQDMIQSLVDIVGPFLDAENATFMRLDEEKKNLICEIQWRKDGTDTGLGEKVPFHVFKRVFGKPFYSFSVDDVPAFAKPIISPIMKKYGTKSSLIVPFGDSTDPEGYLNANTYTYSKKFTDDEIQILTDAVKVISLKSSQIEAIDKVQKNEKILKGLSESQKMLLDNIQTQVWFLSDDHTYGQVNKAHAEFNGLKKEDLAFKDMYDVFPKDVVDVCKEGNGKVFTEKKPIETEEWVPHVSGQQRLIKIYKNPKFDGNGNVEYVVCSAEDITDQKKAEDELKIRLKFEHLISEISSTFVNINPNDKDKVINNALSLIGQFSGVDRAYMFLFANNGQIMNNTHEWCAEGINPEITRLKNISIDDRMPWFASKIRKGDVFQIVNVDDLPAEANLEQQHFRSQGIKSLIVVPMVSSNDVMGFIGFDAVRNQREWSDDDQSILKLAGEIISRALERTASEELLKRSEIKYRSIIENMQDVYYRANIEGNLDMISPSALNVFGYDSLDEIIGLNISNNFYAQAGEREKFLNELKKNNGKITNYEVELRRKDGSIVPVITSSSFYYDDSGTIAGVEGIFSDITERKKIESALSTSESNFRTFFETIDDLIFIGNQKGEIFFTNGAVKRKLGYSADELNKMHVLDVHPAEKRQEAEQIFADMFAGRRSSCPLPLQKKDGTYLPVETRVWFGKWDGKESIFGISKDLSEEHAALEKFHKLFDGNPALMALSSIPGREFVEVNSAFLEKLGYSRGEILGKTASELDIFVQKEKQIEIADKLKKYGFIKDIELKVKCKDGTILDGVFSGEIIDTQMGKNFLTVMVDITDRKKVEGEVTEQMAKTTLLNKIISEGIATQDISKYFENILSMVIDKLNFDAGGIYLVDKSGKTASLFCSKDIPTEFLKMIQTVDINENPTYVKLFKHNEPVVIENYRENYPEKSKISGCNSIVSMPIDVDGKVAGALNISRKERAVFDDSDLELIRSVTNQIAIVMKRLKFEEELKEKLDELERWKKVTVGRELRMRELKEKIRTLESEK